MGDRAGIQGTVRSRWAGSAARAGSGVLVAVAALGAVVAYVVRRQPPRAVGVLGGRGPVLFGARSPERQVAITIDDGPTGTLTPRLLEVLAAHDARATFFMLGAGVQAHPDVVQAVREAGHEIGNHGWSDRPAGLQTRAHLADDLARTCCTTGARNVRVSWPSSTGCWPR